MIADRVEAATQPTSAEPSDSPLSDAPVHSRIPLDMPDEPLTGAELNRIQQLRRVIDEYYEKIPIVLRVCSQ